MTQYLVPCGLGVAELVEKRSRFIGHVRPVETEEEAKAFISEIKKQHYDARHNCWCYIIRDGAERYSDDGEPQGTAGIPMLEVFRREGVYNFVCVVTRYFGGVLLGAGGLLRAYTKSAKDALDNAGTALVGRWLETEFSCGYSLAQRLKMEVSALGGAVSSMDYGADISVKALIPEEQGQAFCERIFDLSGGSVSVRITGESFRAVAL